MEQYPAVAFVVKYGKQLALLCGLLPPLIACLALYAANAHWLWSLLALATMPITYLMAKTAVEMVAVVADMLLPK